LAFESLSFEYTFTIDPFPPEWLPLTYLYDPDLPLFPIQYFHLLDPQLPPGRRPGERDRLYGFVHHVNLVGTALSVTVVVNKDVHVARFSYYKSALENEVKARLGLENPVTLADVEAALSGNLSNSNQVVKELWYKVIDGSFGNTLPFGRMWDGVFGLVRFVASWNSDGGRKGELIQTHCFASEFGEKIQAHGGVHADFFLLPTLDELKDSSNPLSYYPRFAALVSAAEEFASRYCVPRVVGTSRFSAFSKSKATTSKQLDTNSVLEITANASAGLRRALFENFSAFNRGPQRSVIFLMMLHDLRHRYWDPSTLSASDCGVLYNELGGTYQTPKVIALYSQQCAGNEQVLPIDNWVKTFLKWPLDFRPSKDKNYFPELFACSLKWGKVERLIWIAAQARKVHSSVCKEILWCVRYGDREGTMRGANPFSCKICQDYIREACPSYARIAGSLIAFNALSSKSAAFRITTSARDNSTGGQLLESCAGSDSTTNDTYSVRDRPDSFKAYPQSGHSGTELTVSEFIQRY